MGVGGAEKVGGDPLCSDIITLDHWFVSTNTELGGKMTDPSLTSDTSANPAQNPLVSRNSQPALSQLQPWPQLYKRGLQMDNRVTGCVCS